MKKSVLVSLLLACLPLFVMAQSNDDLYFIPKKKTEKKVTSGTPARSCNVIFVCRKLCRE